MTEPRPFTNATRTGRLSPIDHGDVRAEAHETQPLSATHMFAQASKAGEAIEDGVSMTVVD